jgi:hypothetical protein
MNAKPTVTCSVNAVFRFILSALDGDNRVQSCCPGGHCRHYQHLCLLRLPQAANGMCWNQIDVRPGREAGGDRWYRLPLSACSVGSLQRAVQPGTDRSQAGCRFIHVFGAGSGCRAYGGARHDRCSMSVTHDGCRRFGVLRGAPKRSRACAPASRAGFPERTARLTHGCGQRAAARADRRVGGAGHRQARAGASLNCGSVVLRARRSPRGRSAGAPG